MVKNSIHGWFRFEIICFQYQNQRTASEKNSTTSVPPSPKVRAEEEKKEMEEEEKEKKNTPDSPLCLAEAILRSVNTAHHL